MRTVLLPLADIIANDPDVAVIDDNRSFDGTVSIKCPNDDGSPGHRLTVCNPVERADLPAAIFCDHSACRNLSTDDFIALLGCIPHLRH